MSGRGNQKLILPIGEIRPSRAYTPPQTPKTSITPLTPETPQTPETPGTAITPNNPPGLDAQISPPNMDREALKKKVKATPGKAGLKKKEILLKLLEDADAHQGEDASVVLRGIVSELLEEIPKVDSVSQIFIMFSIHPEKTETDLSKLTAGDASAKVLVELFNLHMDQSGAPFAYTLKNPAMVDVPILLSMP
jgi:hypothetical protein